MDELRTIKKQSTAYLPRVHWVKSGVFPFFISLCLHIGIVGVASLALYAAYDKSAGGSAQLSEPVFVTFVQEVSERANILDETKPVVIEKPQPETPPKILPKPPAQKQDIITDIEQDTVPLLQENIKDLEVPDKNEQKKEILRKALLEQIKLRPHNLKPKTSQLHKHSQGQILRTQFITEDQEVLRSNIKIRCAPPFMPIEFIRATPGV